MQSLLACLKQSNILINQIVLYRTIMFRQLLQLNLNAPHNKQAYSLKRNQLVIKQIQQSIKFDAICYSSEDIVSKIILELVKISSKNTKPTSLTTLTATFNYNLQAKDLILIIEQILQVKIFSKSKFRIGHFQIRNGHISDYNRSSNKKENKLIDDLDQFQKEIDNWLKLQRLWKINQYLTYKDLSLSNIHNEMTHSSKKFGKRTNQFFIIEIDQSIRLILIILPRSRDFVLTREQQKEIQELYIINKHSNSQQKQNICFNTPIAQIINNYLQHSQLNLFVSSFPQPDKELTEAMKLSLRLGNPKEEEIKHILQSYNKDKWQQLEHQTQKMKKKLKEFQYSMKAQQQNMQRLIKIYSKTFNKTFASIDYLHRKQITNIVTYNQWLKSQIKRKQQQIESEQAQLKQIHRQMIKDQERHLFYLNKIKKYKDNVVLPTYQSPSVQAKVTSMHHQKQNGFEPTQEELMYFYDPQKEINRYRQLKEEQLKNKLSSSSQKKAFNRLVEEAKYKMNKFEFNKLEQDFYDIISA